MPSPSSLERLESRIAPAALFLSSLQHAVAQGLPSATIDISADGKTATFTDADGDICSISTSKGKFTVDNFLFTPGEDPSTGTLRLIDISFDQSGKMFQGAKIAVTVDEVVGDGLADVGFLNAAGIDLNRAVIGGDLGRIDVGDSNAATPAIKLLTAEQFGFHGLDLLPSGVTDGTSHVVGAITRLEFGDWTNALLDVTGGANPKQAKFGQVVHAAIGSMTGGDGELSATLRASGAIGDVVIQGGQSGLPAGIIGGEGDFSGAIWSRTKIKSVSIGADLTGGLGDYSGAVIVGSPDVEGASSTGGIGLFNIGGNLLGGTGTHSGSLVVGGTAGKIAITGDVKGGTGNFSGSLEALNFTSIVVDGTLTGGDATSGILARGTIGSALLASIDVEGGTPYITAAGPAKGGIAIKKLEVSGDATGAKILAGYDPALVPVNANASIGKIFFEGNLTATDVVAGIDSENGIFGDGDDHVIDGDTKAKVLAKIGTFSVFGLIEGTAEALDSFAITAERIDVLTLGGISVKLSPKVIDSIAFGTMSDYQLKEVGAV